MNHQILSWTSSVRLAICRTCERGSPCHYFFTSPNARHFLDSSCHIVVWLRSGPVLRPLRPKISAFRRLFELPRRACGRWRGAEVHLIFPARPPGSERAGLLPLGDGLVGVRGGLPHLLGLCFQRVGLGHQALDFLVHDICLGMLPMALYWLAW